MRQGEVSRIKAFWQVEILCKAFLGRFIASSLTQVRIINGNYAKVIRTRCAKVRAC
jgi:hypothetical protein